MISKFTLTCISLQTIWTKYFMFCLVNFMSFVNRHPSCHSDLQHIPKKVWDSKSIYHFVMLPFLFTTLKRRLGTEDTKWWSVSGVILSHSSCKTSLKVGNSTGVFVVAFCASKCATILYWRQVRDCRQGQSSTRTLFLRSQDFVMCAECGFALSCWNMHGRPWKRCLLEGSILCSPKSLCTFQH